MALRDEAIRVIAEFAADKIPQAGIQQQIKIYQALGELLAGSEAVKAKTIARSLSRIAAQQMDFHGTLFGKDGQ